MSEEEIIKEIYNILKTFEIESEKAFDINYKNNESFQAIQGLLDLYQKEKEKNKTLEELLQGRLFELYNYYKDLAGSYQANCISKDKITNILGLDSTETEEAILQYIQTLETENARLEDIENKKVQIEYELVFNKGANSIKDKIKEKIKRIEEIYKEEMKPYQTEYGLNVSFLNKKEKEELINKRNSLLTQIEAYKLLLEEE